MHTPLLTLVIIRSHFPKIVIILGFRLWHIDLVYFLLLLMPIKLNLTAINGERSQVKVLFLPLHGCSIENAIFEIKWRIARQNFSLSNIWNLLNLVKAVLNLILVLVFRIIVRLFNETEEVNWLATLAIIFFFFLSFLIMKLLLRASFPSICLIMDGAWSRLVLAHIEPVRAPRCVFGSIARK